MASNVTNGSMVSEKETRELQELFKGRFPKDVIESLLKHFHGDKKAAANHVFKGRFDAEDTEQDDVLKDINSKLRSMNLSDESVAQLKRGKIPSTVRQFACGDCDRDWWQNVPTRKEVSTCRVCKRRFDAIPREEEYGWAVYKCECGHKFNGYGQKNVTTSECFKCGKSVLTEEIRPKGRRTRKSASAHKCDAEDCAFKDCHDEDHSNRGSSSGGKSHYKGKKAECVHPRSRANKRKKVLVSSNPHRSTGSTVDTFLPQDLGVLSDEEKVVIFSSDDDEDRLEKIRED